MITLYRYLFNIKGISHFWAHKICTLLGVNHHIPYSQLSDYKLDLLASIISQLKKSDKLRNLDVPLSIKKLVITSSYRGRRHVLGLPVRGQRTRSNAQTALLNKKRVNSSSF